MVHIRTGNHQHWITLPPQDLGQGAPQRFELDVTGNAQSDRYKAKITRQRLKKRKLHFEGMLGLMRYIILTKRGISLSKLAGQFGIDFRAAQRRLPGTVRNNGLILSPGEMPRAEQKETPRQFQTGINSSGNVARIAIPSVRNHTSHRSARRFLRG